MQYKNKISSKRDMFHPFFKNSSYYLICMTVLFVFIGLFTTISPAYRLSSHILANWTNEIESSTFLYLIGMENKAFQRAYPEDHKLPNISSTIFQIATSVKPEDPRSLLGNELPGFSIFDTEIIIAGEGTNYTNLPIESSPPLEEVLKDRHAIVEEEKDNEEKDDQKIPEADGKKVVYIYNSHNRESFLPHLPGVDDADLAHHPEVNITKVSERFAKSLQAKGIGSELDDTDIMRVLKEKGWGYPDSYKASREIAKEALAANKELKYVFDLHRDAISRDKTTKEIDGVPYARIMIVVGAEHENHKKNLEYATKLHYLMDEMYPGLSRGVYPKKGKLTNGVFNQDLSDHALTIEIGGVENNLDELYRAADALADVFSTFYWEAEEVNTKP